MIFEQELKDKGFEIRDDQLYYEFSDFELLRARVSEWDCADGTKSFESIRSEINESYGGRYGSHDDFIFIIF